MTKEREALKLALEALENNRQTHHYCEDTWYSCPKHEDGCANDAEGDECNCGADKANAEIDATITAIKEALAEQDSKDKEQAKTDSFVRQLDEALAQPWEKFCDSNCVWTDHHPDCKLAEQKPVIWMYQNKSTHEVRFQKHMRSFVDHGAWYEVPLYSEPLANQEKTSGSPKPAKPEALRLADAMEYDLDWCDEAAAELRRMYDLLGKANALCRIRAEEIERLKAQPEQEPVAHVRVLPLRGDESTPQTRIEWKNGRPVAGPLYTTPPQRKPLTDEEIDEISKKHIAEGTRSFEVFARAIEEAHSIKELA